MDSIILIRHGQSTANIQRIVSCDNEGYPLTDLGRKQADSIGSQLEGAAVDGIISSPVQRARETSSIIADHLRMPFEIDDRIRESDIGRFNNFKVNGLPPVTHKDLGLETWESHVERFLSLIDSKSGRYVLVSHAYPIRAILCHYLGLGEHESLGIEVRNATATVVDISSRKVLCIGSVFLSPRVSDYLGEPY